MLPLAATVDPAKLTGLMLIVGLLSLPLWFFKRRIGGEGGGSDADIVGVIWFLGSIALGLYVVYRA
jgi:hypothetical protein